MPPHRLIEGLNLIHPQMSASSQSSAQSSPTLQSLNSPTPQPNPPRNSLTTSQFCPRSNEQVLQTSTPPSLSNLNPFPSSPSCNFLRLFNFFSSRNLSMKSWWDHSFAFFIQVVQGFRLFWENCFYCWADSCFWAFIYTFLRVDGAGEEGKNFLICFIDPSWVHSASISTRSNLISESKVTASSTLTSILSSSLYFLTKFFMILARLALISTPMILTSLRESARYIDLLPGALQSSRMRSPYWACRHRAGMQLEQSMPQIRPFSQYLQLLILTVGASAQNS